MCLRRKNEKKPKNVNINGDLNSGREKLKTEGIDTGNVVDYDEFKHVF